MAWMLAFYFYYLDIPWIAESSLYLKTDMISWDILYTTNVIYPLKPWH